MGQDGKGTSSGASSSGTSRARATGSATTRAAGRTTGRVTARPSSRSTGTTRPRPSARTLTAGPDPRPSSGWVRGAVLLSILVLLAVTLLPTARSVIRQRSEISTLQDNIATQTSTVAGLQGELGRWKDPAYVEQQARERLKFDRPGEVSYSVIDPTQAAPAIPSGAVVAAPSSSGRAPWYGQLWTSMQLADRPTAGMDPVAAK